MTTTGTDLRIISSSTLGGLHNGTNTQVYTSDVEKEDKNVWAGELHKIDGSWYIYYSFQERPWVVKGGADPLDEYPDPPVKLSDYFGIDGTILKYSDKNYFVWSCHTDSPSADSICICRLTSPTTLDWANTGVISYPRDEWEQEGGSSINEAPSALYWEGETYLTFSASHCKSAGYSLGLLHLTGDNPLDFDSWTKTGPVFTSGNGEYGPGHNGVFASPDGTELWHVYHAVTNSAGSCGQAARQTFAQQIDLSQFSTKGPIFGTPIGKGEVVNGPSGE
ncbi:hypothetical protein L202_07067 [Cryptococcus amylolentus CBS 6039]|uniref:Uncharacterized protein n=2 Tax=Cryptococcus amylolentus TaxID=104669 RepID=A0A1E3HEK3_9TREE|nr:hypothetical protein L202_07067 [Cryptococcus amylolentus CBS 6039]ODN74744.1 hypothetical protein L202_07067 [Cryptococcus amylolentus CBS 6039]ODO01662.1 hypothetical protein I350_06488 [Cryptococcus amylolentus CBS 6273]